MSARSIVTVVSGEPRTAADSVGVRPLVGPGPVEADRERRDGVAALARAAEPRTTVESSPPLM